MSCEAQKTIGVSDCKILPQYFKGFAITNKEYTMTAEEAIERTHWEDDIASGDITLFPTWAFSTENISSEPITEESPLSMIEVHPGNYRIKFSFVTDINQHTAMYSWNNASGRALLVDNNNKIWGTSQDSGANIKGLLLDRVHVEKLFINDGSVSSKSVVNLYFIDNTELDLRAQDIDGSSFVNSLVPLSPAILTISGTPSATEVIFTAATSNNNKTTAISGLTLPDINLVDTSGIAQAPSGLAEPGVTAGLYTITGTGLVTGELSLTVPTLVGPYKTDTAVTVTVV